MNVSESVILKQDTTGLCTTAAASLTAIDWGDSQRGTRQPPAWYNSSLNLFLKRWTSCHELVTQLRFGEEKPLHLLDIYDAMLDASVEHIQACRAIVSALGKLDSSGLGEISLSRAFKKKIQWYESRSLVLVNKIKHEGSTIVLLEMTNGDQECHGYYLESAVGSTALGPDPSVHDSGMTAFSFNKDLRMHVAGVFGISRSISELVSSAFGLEGFNFESSDDSGSLLFDVVRKASELGKIVFPDEVLLPWPNIDVSRHNGFENCVIQYPISTRIMRNPPLSFRNPKINLAFSGDGHTDSYVLPYCGSDIWKKLGVRNPKLWNLL